MTLSRFERALETTLRMLNARAALQMILKDRYPSFVKGFVDEIKERQRESGKSALKICCDKAERQDDQMVLLALLAATIEIIEEDARCAGAL